MLLLAGISQWRCTPVQSKQLCQGLLTQSLAGLGDGIVGNVWIDLVRQHQIELGHHLCDRLVSVHRQGNEQLDDLFGRQFTSPNAGFAGAGQGLCDPLGIQVARKC